MAESTLSLSYPDFVEEIGFHLGYGRTSGSFSAKQADDVDSVLSSGYRRFLYPVSILGEKRSHQWSFLWLNDTIATVADVSAYDIPDTYGSIEGEITFNTGEGIWAGMQIRIIGEGKIRMAAQPSSLTSRPKWVAIRPKNDFDATTGQRFEFLFWPIPDKVYNIKYRYKVLVNKLTVGNPFPVGGSAHSETLLESCLAVAEERIKDERGIHSAAFLERLTASIRSDREQTPEFLGYNGDNSSFNAHDHFRCRPDNTVTYEGA